MQRIFPKWITGYLPVRNIFLGRSWLSLSPEIVIFSFFRQNPRRRKALLPDCTRTSQISSVFSSFLKYCFGIWLRLSMSSRTQATFWACLLSSESRNSTTGCRPFAVLILKTNDANQPLRRLNLSGCTPDTGVILRVKVPCGGATLLLGVK